MAPLMVVRRKGTIMAFHSVESASGDGESLGSSVL